MGEIGLHKTAILITGTLVPNSTFVAHTNVAQRRQEYLDSLAFYREQFSQNDIFFLENSSHDFELDKEFTQALEKLRITLLKFPVSERFSEGKGYQEFEMLDKAVQQLGNTYDHFIKITGRYRVLNILQLVPATNYAMVADSHKKHRVTQTNVFMVGVNFYREHLANLYKQANDAQGRFIEHVIYDQIVKKDLLNKVHIFGKNPVITGFSGSYGGTLNRNKYKMILRNVERKWLRAFGVHQFVVEY